MKHKQFKEWSIEANSSHMPDTDRRFVNKEFLAEGSTFLWVPWTLAELNLLSSDSSLTEDERKAATQLRPIFSMRLSTSSKIMSRRRSLRTCWVRICFASQVIWTMRRSRDTRTLITEEVAKNLALYVYA